MDQTDEEKRPPAWRVAMLYLQWPMFLACPLMVVYLPGGPGGWMSAIGTYVATAMALALLIIAVASTSATADSRPQRMFVDTAVSLGLYYLALTAACLLRSDTDDQADYPSIIESWFGQPAGTYHTASAVLLVIACFLLVGALISSIGDRRWAAREPEDDLDEAENPL